MKEHWIATKEVFRILHSYRHLTLEMAKREITERYSGQMFGMLWSIGHPLVMIGIYVFIFNFVFKAKIGGTIDMPLDYTTYILSGLIPWFAAQDAMTKSASVIVSNSSLVKQVVFPLEILPVKSVLASAFTLTIMFGLLLLYLLACCKLPTPMILLTPLLFGLQIVFLIGIAYVFSAVGTYFRDLKDLVQVFCLAGIYAMPIFYLPESVPSIFKPVLYLNPFSYMAWCYQDAIYFGRMAHPWAWLVFSVMSIMSFYLGYRVFRKLKVFFGSVL